jgi:hypothetical protein
MRLSMSGYRLVYVFGLYNASLQFSQYSARCCLHSRFSLYKQLCNIRRRYEVLEAFVGVSRMLITNYHVDVARKVLDEVPSYSASRRLMFGSKTLCWWKTNGILRCRMTEARPNLM